MDWLCEKQVPVGMGILRSIIWANIYLPYISWDSNHLLLIDTYRASGAGGQHVTRVVLPAETLVEQASTAEAILAAHEDLAPSHTMPLVFARAFVIVLDIAL